MSSYWPETCKEIFERHWRCQIQTLLRYPDDHPAALLGMFACMDLALTCKKGNPFVNPTREQQNTADELVRCFFPPDKFPYSEKLAKELVNGLKHVAFVRPCIGLQDTWNGVDHVAEPIRKEGNYIMIAPTAFWNHVKAEIDRIYAEKDCSFPREDESEECKPD